MAPPALKGWNAAWKRLEFLRRRPPEWALKQLAAAAATQLSSARLGSVWVLLELELELESDGRRLGCGRTCAL